MSEYARVYREMFRFSWMTQGCIGTNGLARGLTMARHMTFVCEYACKYACMYIGISNDLSWEIWGLGTRPPGGYYA